MYSDKPLILQGCSNKVDLQLVTYLKLYIKILNIFPI